MAYTTIDKPTDYFNTKLYTGNGTTDHAITGVGFQPDFVWLKKRSATDDHILQDVVRGAIKYLSTNLTVAESSYSEGFKSFDSDGFTLGNANNTNQNTNTFASWSWKAGGTGSSNTDGSITSNVSASTTSGFSIVSYTGTGANATVGHGLGAVPKMLIVKNRTDSASWFVYHGSLGTPVNEYVQLNSTNAVGSNSGTWNSNPTSSVFGLGSTFGALNGSSKNYIAYCFAEKKGFSKFGSYTGNGNADGTFIYTGFKPAWVMIKRTDCADAWFMFDNKRAGAYSPNTNPSWEFLLANASNSGANTDRIDLYSNGFKMRYAWDSINASGGSYIYMCFAENPFVTSTGIPTTAR